MARAFISLGSNIHPAWNTWKALRRLACRVTLVNLSTVYCTEPIGRPGQPRYFNCVAEIETSIPPLELKRTVLRHIETALGRKRSEDKYASRPIDLDLIAYDQLTVQEAGLVLPDPEILKRPFLAMGLKELWPDMVLAGYGERIGQIALSQSTGGMKPLPAYTQLLRSRIHHAIEHRSN